MTFDECVNVARGMLVATLYNFIMQLQRAAMMEKSSASTMPPASKSEIGVPLIASQNLMSFLIEEASWELSGENLTEQSQEAFGWLKVAIRGSHRARPPRSQHALYVISLQC